MRMIPTPEYTDAELSFARALSEEAGLKNDGIYFSELEELEDAPVPIPLGTDAAQVSHTVPMVTISAATMCRGTHLHHPIVTKQSGMSIGHKGMLYAARCMAEGTKRLLETPDALKRAWEFHKK